MNVVSKQPWGVVTLDMTLGKVLVRQDWEYTWTLHAPSLSAWTYAERKAFHDTIDRQIWGVWSNRVRFTVAGSTTFSKHHAKTGILANFDIRWVTTTGHWKVNVRKIAKGASHTSTVTFATKSIQLDSEDVVPHGVSNDAKITAKDFLTAPHEFGHTLKTDDEYKASSPYLADTKSIMNIGRELRTRHLKLLTDTLNKLLPGVTFTPPAVIP